MKRRNEVLVGIMVLVCIAVGIVGTLWLARGGLSSGYPVYSRFGWGQGLKQGQPVLLSGVNIGYVKRITLDYNGSVVTELHINEDMKIPVGTVASVAANGFFGDVLIRLDVTAPANQYYQSGDTIPVSPAQAVGISELMNRADAITATVQGLSAALDSQLVRSGGIKDLRGSLQSLNTLLKRATTVVDTQSAQVSRLTGALSVRINAIDTNAVDSTIKSVTTASQNLSALSADLRRTNLRVDTLLANLDAGRGTAGKLLTDSSLFVQSRTTLARYDSVAIDLRALIADFMAHPKKYVNLSIF